MPDATHPSATARVADLRDLLGRLDAGLARLRDLPPGPALAVRKWLDAAATHVRKTRTLVRRLATCQRKYGPPPKG